MLRSLSFETVRPWVCQSGSYLDTIRVSHTEEKMLLLQYLEGSPLTFVEGFGEASSARECIRGLLAYVKPSQATIMRKLLYLKQSLKEPLATFVTRFNGAAVEARVNEERLKEAFVEALLVQWQTQTRAILASDHTVDSRELTERLGEIGGPMGMSRDPMELGQQQLEQTEAISFWKQQ